MAEVVHRYQRDPSVVAERAAEKKAQAERRQEETKRKDESKRAAARVANRGAAGLRKERTKFERVKRLEREMEVAERRGELIERETVLKQAGFIFVSLRQAILGFPSRYARTMVGITDPRQAQEVLTRAAHEFLTELAGFAERMTANPDGVDDENGAPLRQDDGGPIEEG